MGLEQPRLRERELHPLLTLSSAHLLVEWYKLEHLPAAPASFPRLINHTPCRDQSHSTTLCRDSLSAPLLVSTLVSTSQRRSAACSRKHCFSTSEKIMSSFVNNINYQWPSSLSVRVVSIKISETLNLRHLLLRTEHVGWCYTTKEKHIWYLWDWLEAACLTDCKWHFLWGVNSEISMWTLAEVLTMVRLSPGPSVSPREDVLLLCFGLGIAELNDLPSREPNLSEFSFSH